MSHDLPVAASQRTEFEIILSGSQRLRPFLHLVTNSCKLTDSLFLEVSATAGLGIRAVNASKSVHQLAIVPPASFDSFTVRGAPEAEFLLSTKSLAASVLRYNPYLQKVTITNCGATRHEQQVGGAIHGHREEDNITFLVHSQNGLNRTFVLPMQNGTSEKAHVDPHLFQFEAIADPKVWASVFSCFPSNIHRILVMPQRGRLTLRGADDAAVLDDSMESSVGCSVSADAKTFSVFSYPGAAPTTGNAAAHEQLGGGRSSVGGMSRLTLPSAPPPPAHSCAGGVGSYTALPGKIVEFKAIKIFCMLCEQLQLAAKLSSGGVTVPAQWDGVARTVGQAPSRAAYPGSVAAASGELSFVSHLSLIVAAVDCEQGGAAGGREGASTAAQSHHDVQQDHLVSYTSMTGRAGGASSVRLGNSSVVDRGMSMGSMVAASHVSMMEEGAEQLPALFATPVGPPAAADARKRPRDGNDVSSISRVQTHVSASSDGRDRSEGSVVMISSSNSRDIGGGASRSVLQTALHTDDKPMMEIPSSGALQQFPLDFNCFFPSAGIYGGDASAGEFEGEDAFEDLALQQFLGVAGSTTTTNRGNSNINNYNEAGGEFINPTSSFRGLVVVGESQHSA